MRMLPVLALLCASGCGGGNGSIDAGSVPRDAPPRDAPPVEPPPASCTRGPSPQPSVAMPRLIAELGDRWHEGWLASPAIADLDGDGTREIVGARAAMMLAWHLDG